MMMLQEQINKAKPNSIINIPESSEVIENIIIKKPITIMTQDPSASGTIVGKIVVMAENVTFKNINLVNFKDVCLSIKKSVIPIFNNVFIIGKTEGMDESNDEWEIPDSIDLLLKTDTKISRNLVVRIPVEVKVYIKDLNDVSCTPSVLPPGHNLIKLAIEHFPKDSLLTGNLILESVSTGLKRRIALHGSTLNSELENKIVDKHNLWTCNSFNFKLDNTLLTNLPEGRQGEAYEYAIEIKKLGIEDWEVQIENLPEGFKYTKENNILKICGISKQANIYDLIFWFKKNNIELSYQCKLTINKMLITPLILEKNEEKILTKENEEINILPVIKSSNSQTIIYSININLPDKLKFDSTTGAIMGKILKHGIYSVDIRIEDGSNEIVFHIDISVLPKEDLQVKIEKQYTFFQNEIFSIPISITNSGEIDPVCTFPDLPSSLQFDAQNFRLFGMLTELKEYKIKLKITDKYNRQAEQVLHIICNVKVRYTIKWLTADKINVTNEIGSDFSQKIEAQIIEAPDAEIKYKLLRSESSFLLSEEGILTGKINNKMNLVRIQAFFNDVIFEKEFMVMVKIDPSRIISLNKQVSNIFSIDNSSAPEKIQFNKQLKDGIINESYCDCILSNRKSQISYNFKVENLPEGLKFNKHNLSIEGVPKNTGSFILKIRSDMDRMVTDISLFIKQDIFSIKLKSTNEEVKKEEETDDPKKTLGVFNDYLKKKEDR